MKNAIARRYAQAFFRLVRQEDLTAAQDGLHALSLALKDSPAFKHVLASPVFTLDEKLQVLTTLCERTGCPPIMGRFCEQLLKKNRIGFLPEIAEAFKALMIRQSGKQQIVVVSAQPVDDTMKQDILAQLGATAKGEVDVDFQSDPSLLAGVQIKIGSKVFDGTVRGRLHKMRAQLVKG